MVPADEPCRRALDAVEPVRRRVPELLEPERERGVDALCPDAGGGAVGELVVRPGRRSTRRGIRRISTRRHEERGDPDEQQDKSEHGERGRELELAGRRLPRLGRLHLGFGNRLGGCNRLWLGCHATSIADAPETASSKTDEPQPSGGPFI